MASEQYKQKRQQIDNERKRSYVDAGKSALNQSAGAQSTVMKTNPSNQDVGMSQGSGPSRGQIGYHTNANNASSIYQQSKQA